MWKSILFPGKEKKDNTEQYDTKTNKQKKQKKQQNPHRQKSNISGNM